MSDPITLLIFEDQNVFDSKMVFLQTRLAFETDHSMNQLARSASVKLPAESCSIVTAASGSCALREYPFISKNMAAIVKATRDTYTF